MQRLCSPARATIHASRNASFGSSALSSGEQGQFPASGVAGSVSLQRIRVGAGVDRRPEVRFHFDSYQVDFARYHSLSAPLSTVTLMPYKTS